MQKRIFIFVSILLALMSVYIVIININFEGIGKIAFFMGLIGLIVLVRIFTWKTNDPGKP